MPEKGSYNGECFTPGCTRESRWIATVEAPVVDVPQERYRCVPCCGLVTRATPIRPAGVLYGMPGYDEWRTDMLRVLALPLAELEAAATLPAASEE